jgi:hypothetical protein
VLDPRFKALIVGVHWPSLPWGNEDQAAALLGDDDTDEFAAEQQMSSEELIQRYAERIADTTAARAALTTILAAAHDDTVREQLAAGKLPPRLEAAYQTLFDQAGLGVGGAAAAPGSDQETFTPALTITAWTSARPGQAELGPEGQPGLLGGLGHNAKDALLMPVRQLSFWAMKRRARRVGETGAHTLLTQLQNSAPDARFHLMGHSFGCIVVSAAVSGPPPAQGGITAPRARPVHSLFLVQGAMSLWSFAERIPYTPNSPGYFRPVQVPPARVTGPIVTTRSTFDHAVGTFYPLAAKLAGQEALLAPGPEWPEFGGLGAFGIRGTAAGITHDAAVLDPHGEYGFDAGAIYNIEASTVIRHGPRPAGAHSDISHPEIAHVFWQAAHTGIAKP